MDPEDPLEEGMDIPPLENPHGQSSLAGYCPWGHRESDTTKATNHACMQHKSIEIADLIRVMILKLV